MATDSSPDSFIDVRYSKFYTGITILLSLVFLAIATFEISSRWGEQFTVIQIIWHSGLVIVGLLLIYSGITLRTRRYLRLDSVNNTLMVYGIIGSWSRKYPYDFVYHANEKFIIESKGQKKKINFLKYACDISDLSILLKAISESNRGK